MRPHRDQAGGNELQKRTVLQNAALSQVGLVVWWRSICPHGRIQRRIVTVFIRRSTHFSIRVAAVAAGFPKQ